MRAASEVMRTFDMLKNKSELAGKSMSKDFDGTGASATKFGHNLARDVTAGSMAASKAVTQLGKAFSIGLSVPGIAALTAMSKASIAFENDLIGVGKTTNMAGAELEAFGESVLMAARTLPAAHSEILNVAEAAGQLGIQKQYILSFTDTMIKMGVATNLSATDAAEAFARFASIVGMSSDDFDRLGATVVHLGNNLATSEKEIVDMGLRLSGVATQVGLTEHQVMGLAGALSSVGLSAEAGGSATTRVLQKMNTAVIGSTDKLQGFAKVAGVSAEEFAAAWRNDPVEAFQLFVKGLDGVTQSGEDATAILKDLEITSVREKDVLLRLAGANELLTDSINWASQAWEENIALSDEAAMRFASTEGKIQLAKNAMNEFAKRTGDAAKEGLVPLIEKFTPMINGFNDMTPAAHQAIVGIVGFSTALGPMLLGAGKVGEAFSTLPESFEVFTEGLKGAKGKATESYNLIAQGADTMKTGISNTFTQLGEVTKGFGELFHLGNQQIAKEFPMLALSFENGAAGIGETFNKMNSSVTQVLGQMGTSVNQSFTTMTTAITGQTEKLQPVISALEPLFASIPKMAGTSMTGLTSAIKMGLTALAPGMLVGAIVVGLGALYSAFEEQIDAIAQVAIHKGPYIISNLTRGMVQKIPEFAAKGTELMTLFAQAIVANLPVIFEGGVQIIEEIARAVMNNAPQLVSNAVMVIGTFAQGLASAIPRLVVAGFEIILGLVKGIVQNLPLIIEQGLKAVTNLITGIGQNMGSVLSIGAEIIMTLIEGILSLITQLPQIALELMRAFIAGIKEAFGSIKEMGGQLVGKIKEGIFGKKKDAEDGGKATTESFEKGANSKNVEWVGQEKMNEVVKGAKDESHKMGEVGTDSIDIFQERIKREEPAAEQAGKDVMDSTAKGAESEKDKMGQAADKGSSNFLENILKGNPDASAAGAGMANASTEGMDSKQVEAGGSGQNLVDSFVKPIDEAIPTVKEKSQELVNSMTSTLTEQAPKVEESGVAIVTAITNGITSQLDMLNEVGGQVVDAIITAITNETEQLSTIGSNVMTSIIDGINEEAETLEMTGEMIVQTILQSIIEQLPMLEMLGNEMILMIIEAIQIGIPLLIESGMSIIEAVNEGMIQAKDVVGETMTMLSEDIALHLEEISILAGEQSNNIGLAMQEGIGSAIPQIIESFINIETAVTQTLNIMSEKVSQISEEMMSKIVSNVESKAGQISSSFDKMGTSLTSGMSKTSTNVQKSSSQMMDNVTKNINNGATKTQTAFENMGSKVSSQVENMSKRINSSITNMTSQMTSGVTNGTNSSTRAFTNMSSEVVSSVRTMSSSVVSAADNMMSSFNSSFSSGLSRASSNLDSSLSSMVSTTNSYRGQFDSAGRNLMSGLQAGIRGGRSGVINAARDVMRAAVAAAKAAAEIHSPSRVMRDEVGAMLTLGIAEGVVSTSGYLDDKITETVEDAIARAAAIAKSQGKSIELLKVSEMQVQARADSKQGDMNNYLTKMYREALDDREKFVKAMSRISDYSEGRFDDLLHADHNEAVGYMAEIVQEINNIADETERAAIVAELFGDSWDSEMSKLVSEVGSFQNSFQPSSWYIDEAKLLKIAGREVNDEVREINEKIKEENKKIQDELKENPIKPEVSKPNVDKNMSGNWEEAIGESADAVDKATRDKLIPVVKKSMDDVIYLYRTYNEMFRNTGKDYIINLANYMVSQFEPLKQNVITEMNNLVSLYRSYNEMFRNTGKDFMLNMREAMAIGQAQTLDDARLFMHNLLNIYDDGTKMIQGSLKNLNATADRTLTQSINLTQQKVQPLEIRMDFGGRSYGTFVNDIKNANDKTVHLEEIYGL